MTQYLAIKGWHTGDITAELKRSALFFDQIAIKHVHGSADCEAFPQLLSELDLLKERDIVRDAPQVAYDTEMHPWLAGYDRLLLENPSGFLQRFLLENLDYPDKLTLENADKVATATYQESADAYSRVAALTLNTEEICALPLLSKPPSHHRGLPTKKTELLHMAFDNLPMPNELTPWEDIIAWRSDADAKLKFHRLKDWVNKTARSDAPVAEMQDELECAVHEYRAFTQAHYKTFRANRFELFAVAIAKFLEELPKIKISPLVEASFSARRRRLELTEKESSAKGRELAYIVATQDRFG